VYLKYGMIDRTAYLDVSSGTIVRLWETVWPVVRARREVIGGSFKHALYENFEYLAVISRQWIERHPAGAYPKGTPRWQDVST
jgi:hypothetical protein